MNLEGPTCAMLSCSIRARSQRDFSKKHNCMDKWTPNLEGFNPEKFTVQVKERDTCVAQTSLGTDEPAVAGGTTNGYGKETQPMAMTEDLPKIHPSCWSCNCLDLLQLHKANKLLGLDTQIHVYSPPSRFSTVFQGVDHRPNHTCWGKT